MSGRRMISATVQKSMQRGQNFAGALSVAGEMLKRDNHEVEAVATPDQAAGK